MDITEKRIEEYRQHLIREEKSTATTQKYVRDITVFSQWLGRKSLSKAEVLNYKEYLIERYAPISVNSTVSSLNSFFDFNGLDKLKVKTLKIQKQIFSKKENELTKSEYIKLLLVAKEKNKRLYYLMQTVCSTGIRISELKFITVESIKCGMASINCKGKMRLVFLPEELCKMLKEYAGKNNISEGAVFITKSGRPLDRSNIWTDMKKLCSLAGVSEDKVFPHNLRHLFARCYYAESKDIVRLADILGHTSVNTTRIYTMESGEIHRRQIQSLGLLMK